MAARLQIYSFTQIYMSRKSALHESTTHVHLKTKVCFFSGTFSFINTCINVALRDQFIFKIFLILQVFHLISCQYFFPYVFAECQFSKSF